MCLYCLSLNLVMEQFGPCVWKTMMFLNQLRRMQSNFFTPIPPTSTSLLLDGTARNLSFLTTWIGKIKLFIVSGYLFPYHLIPQEREEKPFGLCRNQIQVLLLHTRPL